MDAARPATALPPAPVGPGQPGGPPPQARRLAIAGLLPLVLGAAVIWLVYPYPDAHAFVTLGVAGYAATIVAFLGGVHWGLAMRAGVPGPTAPAAPPTQPPAAPVAPPAHYGWACVPPCVAAFGLLMPAYAGLVLLGAMLLVCYAVDRRLYLAHGLGGWLTLRFRLSALSSLCCFIAAAGS